MPLQSGSSRILKLMGRRYTKEEYLELYEKIKKRIPVFRASTSLFSSRIRYDAICAEFIASIHYVYPCFYFIKNLIEGIGFIETDSLKDADLVILNTCAIRENAHDKVFGFLGRCKHEKASRKDMIISICGCMAQEPSLGFFKLL